MHKSIVGCCVALMMASAAPSNAAADAKTVSVVTKAVDTVRAVKSFTCHLSITQRQGGQQQNYLLSFEFQRPDSASLTIANGDGVLVRAVTDGKKLMVHSLQDKQFIRRDVPSNGNAAVMMATVSQSVILKSYLKPQVLSGMLTDASAAPHYMGTSTANGAAVDLINATLDPAPERTVKATFGFGRKDHLLHSVAIVATNGQQQEEVDEVVSAIKTNVDIASADFKIYTPTGAKEMTEADLEPQTYDSRLKPGVDPFPINSVDINGKHVDLAQYRGKVLLVDFWATWCGPCVAEIPNVLDAYNQFHNKGLEVVGFSQDQDEGALKQFIAQRGMPWRQVYCGGPGQGVVPDAYGIQAIPFIMVVGRDGKIAGVNLRGEEIVDTVKAAIAKSN